MEEKREFSSTDCVSSEIEVSLRMIESDDDEKSRVGASCMCGFSGADDGE